MVRVPNEEQQAHEKQHSSRDGKTWHIDISEGLHLKWGPSVPSAYDVGEQSQHPCVCSSRTHMSSPRQHPQQPSSRPVKGKKLEGMGLIQLTAIGSAIDHHIPGSVIHALKRFGREVGVRAVVSPDHCLHLVIHILRMRYLLWA